MKIDLTEFGLNDDDLPALCHLLESLDDFGDLLGISGSRSHLLKQLPGLIIALASLKEDPDLQLPLERMTLTDLMGICQGNDQYKGYSRHCQDKENLIFHIRSRRSLPSDDRPFWIC
jgi:hypothetical protein